MDAAAHTLRCVGDFNTTKVGIELLYMCMCQLRDSANEHAEEDLKRDLKRSAERDSAQFEEDDEDEEEESRRRRARVERNPFEYKYLDGEHEGEDKPVLYDP